ncbi:GntR family transcriptional regulator [Methylorubrum populi]|nr:GntR family transcriptional regulator [Methylorubrum populi]
MEGIGVLYRRRRKVRRVSPARDSVDEGTERKSSLVDDAYEAMRTAIRDSTFAPGYQASEQEIANRLGMSRTPVHEAVIRLQAEGLVEVLPRKGILIVALSPDDLREIYDVVIAIEGRAAELIATLPQAERTANVKILDGWTDEMAAAEKRNDLQAWGNADSAFHTALIQGANNSRMSRIIQTVNDQSHRLRMLTLNLRRGLDASVAEHRRIAQSIRFGNPADAADAARQHRIRARDELLPLLARYGLKHL